MFNEANMQNALVDTGVSQNDKMSMVLNEAVDTMKSHEKIDPLTLSGIQDIASDEVLFNRYLAKLSEGMGSSAINQENFKQIVRNSVQLMVNESTTSSMAPLSTLLMPMLRRAWPKIGIKEAIPTQVAKVPEFKVTTLKPWIKDGSSKAELLVIMPSCHSLRFVIGSRRRLSRRSPRLRITDWFLMKVNIMHLPKILQ